MPDGPVIPDEIRAFLDAPRFATIATLDDDGAPWQAVVWFMREGDTLLINSRRERRWPRNLERDGRAAIAVHDHEKLGHWVGLRGRAEVARTGAGAVDDIAALARRYGGDPEAFRGQDRITFVVRIERTYEYWS
ncbi:MAG TPA: TIGR03618 family F420-dependent PPOX class oxidoreductase [Candidatus Limnocylindrales bacterium]|nr:TIGR03618 family F420-dependent PPOX class oxidoreductase [Candidatus Limnocylindrales bacterium]